MAWIALQTTSTVTEGARPHKAGFPRRGSTTAVVCGTAGALRKTAKVTTEVPQPAEGEQKPADHQQVGRDDPFDRVDLCVKTVADDGKDDVGHTVVQRGHEGPHADGKQDRPLAIHGAVRRSCSV